MENDFSGGAKYYDEILGITQFKKNANFVGKVLRKYNCSLILEAACGTGLYQLPLKKAGFRIEGFDISDKMLQIARKKKLIVRKADMRTFDFKKRYDSILCLNSSLVLLKNLTEIKSAVLRFKKHLKLKGLLLIDIPNHSVEIAECNNSSTTEYIKMKNGKIKITLHDFKKGNKWISEWKGEGIVDRKKVQFFEHYEELIIPPKSIESLFKKCGFNTLSFYGTRDGKPFRPKTSYRRFYILQLS